MNKEEGRKKMKRKKKEKERKSFFPYLHRDYFIIQVFEVRSRFRHYSFLMMYTWNDFN